jgi:hypothetical protein
MAYRLSNRLRFNHPAAAGLFSGFPLGGIEIACLRRSTGNRYCLHAME